MRTMPVAITTALASGDFTGTRKATTRVTIQKAFIGIFNVGTQVYASMPFQTGGDPARELPNIKSVNWDRSAQSDTATCTIELFNTEPLPPGTGPDTAGSFDLIGFYSFNRGRTAYSQTTWGHEENRWQDFLVPDRLVRTYQGYGVDYSVVPELDPHLACTGVWLIDDVTYTADGLITVEMRDLGRLLADHIMLPPVIPVAHYPLAFEQIRQMEVLTTTPPDETQAGWIKPAYLKHSGFAESANQYGHHPQDAFDASDSTWWLSTGNTVPRTAASYEWIEGSVPSTVVRAIRFRAWSGPYTAYLSVKAGGKWQGTKRIPYNHRVDRQGVTNNSDEIYLLTGRVAKNGELIWQLPAAIEAVEAIRITLTDLVDSGLPGISSNAVYRCGIRRIEYTAIGVDGTLYPSTQTVGNYADYSEIVKRLLAYGGFFWPEDAVQTLTDTNTKAYPFAEPDPYLGTDTESIGLGGSGTFTTATTAAGGDTFQQFTVSQSVKVVGIEVGSRGATPAGATVGIYGNDFTSLVADAIGTAPAIADGATAIVPLNTPLTVHPGVTYRVRFSSPAAALMSVAKVSGAVSTVKNLYVGGAQRSSGKLFFRFHKAGAVTGALSGNGRIWGDILMAGTAGPTRLGVDVWDKKPLIDGITYVKDILGFIFHIDEGGGAQFRLPNVYRKGNWQVDSDNFNRTRVATIKVIDDSNTILGLRAKLSSRNIREKVFVANTTGTIGAVANGRNPYPAGLRRVGGWTDQRFETESECVVMADLITLRQLFSYRQDSVRIPADPSVQVDDQVEIRERTSGEAYIHYVSGISSQWDLESGKWTYDLTTSWLGVDPEAEWVFKSDSLNQDTNTFLAALGEA